MHVFHLQTQLQYFTLQDLPVIKQLEHFQVTAFCVSQNENKNSHEVNFYNNPAPLSISNRIFKTLILVYYSLIC